MFSLNDSVFIGGCLQGFFFGLYSAIFIMYLQYQASKTDTDKKNILFYPICLLYVLSVAIFILQVTSTIYQLWAVTDGRILRICMTIAAIIGCCDFTAQSILIYRCWLVWGCNIRVVIIPSILTFTALAMWLLVAGPGGFKDTDGPDGATGSPSWGYSLTVTSIGLSLTVNALVTGLIVFMIFKVYQQVKPLRVKTLGTTAGSKLQPIMFVLIESGMAMFVVQMVRVVLIAILATAPHQWNPNIMIGNNLVIGINEMLYGLTPTIIVVRVSMGLSFHDEDSMVEATVTLCFASDNPNSATETISIVDQESRDDNGVQLRLSDDIRLVERGTYTCPSPLNSGK